MVALAMPPPSHIVCRPYLAPVCAIWCTRAVISRAPEAPSGWPSAIAPAVHVELLGVGAGLGQPGQRDRGEGLVDLEQADVGQTQPGPARAPSRWPGSGAVSMITGSSRGDHGGVHAGQRPQPEPRRRLRRGHQQRGRAVRDLRRRPCGDPAAVPERRLQPRQRLQRPAAADALVDASPLSRPAGSPGTICPAEPALVGRGRGPLVRLERERVELLAATAPTARRSSPRRRPG